jgi:hypothetical protein
MHVGRMGETRKNKKPLNRAAVQGARHQTGPGKALVGPGKALVGPGKALVGPGKALVGPGKALVGPGKALSGPAFPLCRVLSATSASVDHAPFDQIATERAKANTNSAQIFFTEATSHAVHGHVPVLYTYLPCNVEIPSRLSFHNTGRAGTKPHIPFP